MTTSLIAMGIAAFAVVNLVIGLAVLSLLLGTFETLFGKPKLSLLKAQGKALAFGFKWNSAKEPARMNIVKLRLFNPFGKPTQIEIIRSYETQTSSFAAELDMGDSFVNLLGAEGLEKSVVQIEISSEKDGICFQFDMKGPKFKKLLMNANETTKQFIARNKLDAPKESKPPIDIPRSWF